MCDLQYFLKGNQGLFCRNIVLQITLTEKHGNITGETAGIPQSSPPLLCPPPATSMPCCLWRRTQLFLSHRACGGGNWAYMTISSQFPRMGWRDRADNIQPCPPAMFHPQLAGIQTEDLLPCMGEAERWRRWPLHGLQPLLNTVRSLLNPKLRSHFFPCN